MPSSSKRPGEMATKSSGLQPPGVAKKVVPNSFKRPGVAEKMAASSSSERPVVKEATTTPVKRKRVGDVS